MSERLGIEARALRKSYGKRQALAGLDLRIDAGELVALVGANGAGKTTVLSLLSGQIVPDGGNALVGGRDVFAEPLAARRLLGYVGQDLLLPPYLTVLEMAEFACGVKGIALEQQRLDSLLATTGLGDDGDRLIGELSHGMQRKAAWVVALVTAPRALLVDEGLAGLDAASTAAVLDEVGHALGRETAVLWAEHDLTLLAPHIARAVVLRDGQLEEVVRGDDLRADLAAGRLAARMRRWTET
jgi:ABC-2 type transport system ATP-binding protein